MTVLCILDVLATARCISALALRSFRMCSLFCISSLHTERLNAYRQVHHLPNELSKFERLKPSWCTFKGLRATQKLIRNIAFIDSNVSSHKWKQVLCKNHMGSATFTAPVFYCSQRTLQKLQTKFSSHFTISTVSFPSLFGRFGREVLPPHCA